MSFVPVTFELFEDSDIAQQIGAVLADSKAAEKARVFTLGVAASNEPIGLITALVAAGGSTVIATASNVLAAADLYKQPGGASSPLAAERALDDEPNDPERL